MRLARDANFQGLHVGVPLDGVAVHINAFNFPAWGLWEKAAVSLLAGVPVLAKPATSTAWLAQEMVSAVIEAGVLPPGALSILCGSPNDLLDHLQLGDVVAFTGSADTGEGIRQHPRVRQQNIRVNIEADSLNAAAAGSGCGAGFAGVRLLRARSHARDDSQDRAEVHGDPPRSGSGRQGAGGH